MNPFVFAMRRPVSTLMLVVALIGGGVLVLNMMRSDTYASQNTPKIYAYLDYIGTSAKQTKGYVVDQFESYFHKHEEKSHQEHTSIVVTSPKVQEVIITQPYVCQIHSRRHIDVCAMEDGYLKSIPLKEGQEVKEGDVMFEGLQVIFKAKWGSKVAERDLAQLEVE